MINRKVFLGLAGALLAFTSMPYAMAQYMESGAPGGDIADQIAGMADGDMSDIAALAAALPPPDPAMFAALAQAGTEAAVRLADRPGGPAGGGPEGPGGFGHWGAMPWMHHGGLGPLSGPLALSDDQYEKLNSIKNGVSDAIAPKKLQLHQAFRELLEALGKPDQDMGKVKSLQNQISQLKAETSMAETSKLVQMSQVLTADQRHALRMAMIKASICGPHMPHFHH
jgi:Spy/CpxP family protein refolding chaperone